MAVTFFPFNSIVVDGVPDRPANAENLAAYLAGFFSNGVLMQTDTALKVEASSGMNVQIHAGMGNINGKTILADAAEIITLDTASASLARIDRVVFRLDEINRLMEFDVLTGTPASNPVAPALTRSADVYELCLAEIRVPAGATSIIASYITDTRSDADLCGVASIPEHVHDAINIISGTLSADRLPVVPISKGGHGKTTAAAGLLALGGVSIKKLWGNASPTSDFSAQSVIVNYSGYEYVFALGIMSNSDTSSLTYIMSPLIPAVSGNKGYFNVCASDWYLLLREFTLGSNKITFTSGNMIWLKNATVYENWAGRNIPVAIFGVKGVQ